MRYADRGFTIIELAITVVVVAILASIGVPSFVTFLANNRIKSNAESVLQGLQLARAEAIRRNQRVSITFDTDSSWSIETAAGDKIQRKRAKEGSVSGTLSFTPATLTTVTFNAYGRMTSGLPLTTPVGEIEIAATGATARRRIEITPGGQTHLCDPDVNTAGDPRRCRRP